MTNKTVERESAAVGRYLYDSSLVKTTNEEILKDTILISYNKKQY